MLITLPPDYRPSETEEFMNPLQREYFRQKLLRWRQDLLREAGDTLASLSKGGIAEAGNITPNCAHVFLLRIVCRGPGQSWASLGGNVS